VEIEELRKRLPVVKKKRMDELQKLIEEEKRRAVRVKNAEDDIHVDDENLLIEEGALNKVLRNDKPFRCIAFSASNAKGNEVTGTATGGVENFICGEGYNIHMIDFHSGELLHIFIGDDKHRTGDKIGHVGVVTALCYDGSDGMFFSGSVDETILCWNSLNMTLSHRITGHEGTIVVLAVDGPLLVSGSAYTTVRIWDKRSGRQLRALHGHSKSVLSLEFGLTWLLTGSADEEIRLWDVKQKSHNHVIATSKLRLVGHEVAVSAVRYGKLEIVSGDILGRIFIWLVETGAILRQIQVRMCARTRQAYSSLFYYSLY